MLHEDMHGGLKEPGGEIHATFDREICTSEYRVTIHVVPNLPLITKQKFCFSIGNMQSLFWCQWEVMNNVNGHPVNSLMLPFSAGDINEEATQCLELVQMIETIPPAFPNVLNTCGRITVHSTGRYVLVSNRGHDSICVLSVERNTGLLQVQNYTLLDWIYFSRYCQTG